MAQENEDGWPAVEEYMGFHHNERVVVTEDNDDNMGPFEGAEGELHIWKHPERGPQFYFEEDGVDELPLQAHTFTGA